MNECDARLKSARRSNITYFLHQRIDMEVCKRKFMNILHYEFYINMIIALYRENQCRVIMKMG